MSIEQFIFRKATIKDTGGIYKLYKSVSKIPGSLKRDETEISKPFVEQFVLRALKSNSIFVVIDTLKDYSIVGEIHCYKPEPKIYSHIFCELSVAINPAYTSLNLDEKLCNTLLSNITSNRADILRVELVIRESKVETIELYKKLGFIVEGRFDNRVRNVNNTLEADISMAWFNPTFRRK